MNSNTVVTIIYGVQTFSYAFLIFCDLVDVLGGAVASSKRMHGW